MRSHRLASPHLECRASGFDFEHPLQDHRVLVELRSLSRLNPSTGAHHPGDTHGFIVGVHAADELVDQFGLLPADYYERGFEISVAIDALLIVKSILSCVLFSARSDNSRGTA